MRTLFSNSMQAFDMAYPRRAAMSQDLQRLGVFPDAITLFTLFVFEAHLMESN